MSRAVLVRKDKAERQSNNRETTRTNWPTINYIYFACVFASRLNIFYIIILIQLNIRATSS